MKTALVLGMIATAAAGCTTAGDATPDRPHPPWRNETLAASDVPDVYRQQWNRATNRERCALLAFADTGEMTQGATARASNFAGGWAVAYDRPGLPGVDRAGRSCADCGRGAFGIAGTGTTPEGSYSEWPHWIEWRDGSRAGYGPEGGSGPRELAYLTVRGQECLYNVWSFAGREHLEYLLGQLRFVNVTSD